MPDCGDNSCLYAGKRGGMRTNGGCRCDECPICGKFYRRWKPGKPQHYAWCSQPEWIPEHHRAKPEETRPFCSATLGAFCCEKREGHDGQHFAWADGVSHRWSEGGPRDAR